MYRRFHSIGAPDTLMPGDPLVRHSPSRTRPRATRGTLRPSPEVSKERFVAPGAWCRSPGWPSVGPAATLARCRPSGAVAPACPVDQRNIRVATDVTEDVDALDTG
jgi:hypothetical protein